MNDGQRSEEVNSAVEAEAISINLITQAHNEPLDVLPTDRLESEASKTTTVAYIVCPPRGKKPLKFRRSVNKIHSTKSHKRNRSRVRKTRSRLRYQSRIRKIEKKSQTQARVAEWKAKKQ